jgi:peptide chain release factor 3
MTWPIWRGHVFRGVYHRMDKSVHIFDADRAGSSAAKGSEKAPEKVTGLDDPRLLEELEKEGYERLREEAALLDEAGDAFDMKRFIAGEVSPMFFGSAINNFGLQAFLDAFCELMPGPAAHIASSGGTQQVIDAENPEFTGFIFKIQANMNRSHRDRIAFLRVCSGRFERGMKVKLVRTGREMRLANPTTFMAQERTIVEDGVAGDVVGLHDPGVFEIGDTLTQKSQIEFEAIPSFAPEHFARVVMADPMRRKQLKSGLEQLAQEGTIQLYRPPEGLFGDPILGAVGRLQLEVVKSRLENEYDVTVRLEPVSCEFARWVSREDGQPVDLRAFDRERIGIPTLDVRDRPVVLFQGEWQLNSAKREFPGVVYRETARTHPTS